MVIKASKERDECTARKQCSPPRFRPRSLFQRTLSLSPLSRSTRSPARKRSRFKKNSPTGTNLPIFPLFSFLLNFISNTRTAHNTESTRRRRYSISPAVRGREYDIYLLAVPTLVLVSRKNSARVFFYSIATSYEDKQFRNRPAKLQLYHFFYHDVCSLYDQNKTLEF